MGQKSKYEKLKDETFKNLRNIKNKLDPRTYGSYESKIYQAVGLSALNKLTEKFKSINELEQETNKKLTTKKVKQLIEQKTINEINTKRKYDKKALNGAFNEIYFNNWKQFTMRKTDDTVIVYGIPNFNAIQKVISGELIKTPYHDKDYNIIANVIIRFEMIKTIIEFDGRIDYKFASFYYHSAISEKIKSVNQINEFASEQLNGLTKRIEEANKNGSNLRFNKIESITIQISKSKKTRAGTFIQTPLKLKNKRAIINIKNKDDKCIKWSLLCYLHQDKFNDDKNEIYRYKKILG